MTETATELRVQARAMYVLQERALLEYCRLERAADAAEDRHREDAERRAALRLARDYLGASVVEVIG